VKETKTKGTPAPTVTSPLCDKLRRKPKLATTEAVHVA